MSYQKFEDAYIAYIGIPLMIIGVICFIAVKGCGYEPPKPTPKPTYVPKNEREQKSYENGKKWKQRVRGFVKGFIEDK